MFFEDQKMAFSDLKMKKFSENIWSLIYEDPRGSRTVLWSLENFEDRAISVLWSSKTKISKNNIWPIFCRSRHGIGQGGDLGEQTADWKKWSWRTFWPCRITPGVYSKTAFSKYTLDVLPFFLHERWGFKDKEHPKTKTSVNLHEAWIWYHRRIEQPRFVKIVFHVWWGLQSR